MKTLRSRCRKGSDARTVRASLPSGTRWAAAAVLAAVATSTGSARADEVLIWTGSSVPVLPYGDNVETVLEGMGHVVTRATTVLPADLTGFDAIWAMDAESGPNDQSERDAFAAYLRGGGGLYAQAEWDCCIPSQVAWTTFYATELDAAFVTTGSQGVTADAVRAADPFGLTTTPNDLSLIHI